MIYNKVMTQEEKAKAYEERLDTARHIYADPSVKEEDKYYIEVIFPELKESEDERIRKRIIHALHGDVLEMSEIKEAVAWLEKQKTIDVLDKEEKEFADNVDSYRKDMDEFYKKGYNAGREAEKQYWFEKQRKQKLPIENLPSEMKTIEESLGFTTQEECDKYNQMVSELIMSDDKNKPKFKVGDWVVSPNGVYWHIDAIQNGRYEVTADTGQCGNWSLDTNIYRLWTIQDAKDGDVLAEDTCIFIIKKLNNDLSAEIYCCLYDDGDFELNFNLGFDDTCTYPATKEQRDLLFAKIKEAGYEWDAEKKELRKIEQKFATIDIDKMVNDYANSSERGNEEFGKPVLCMVRAYRQGLNDAIGKVGLSPAWNEEDETKLKSACALIKNTSLNGNEGIVDSTIDWLKSIEQRLRG